MKMTNRFIAFCLGLLLTLHSICLPAYANELDEQEDLTAVVEDILVDPTDYVLEAGIAPTSLGLTLTAAQIAALIAGSVGVVFTASNWDALASHMQSALNNAASNISGGTEALLNWWSAAATGDIKLSSADSWIVSTILNTLYNIHQGLSYPQGSYYPNSTFQAISTGSLVSADTPLIVNVGVDSMSGELKSVAAWKFDVPGYVYKVSYLDASAGKGYCKSYFVTSEPVTSFRYRFTTVDNSLNYWYSPITVTNTIYFPLLELNRVYHGFSDTITFSSDNPSLYKTWIDYCQAGSVIVNSLDAYNAFHVTDFFDGDVISAPIPTGDSVLPDVYIGGITDAWTGDIGTDVITLPDISLDGSDLITGDDAASIDTSISTALDKVATGELTWDDLWLDISGAKPEITVKDDAAEDVGPELGLPDWFVDFCDRVTGNPADRNDKIDSLLSGLGDGMASIDDFESDILDQFNNAFNDLDLDGFQLSSGILAALTWLVYWVVQFFNASGDLQVVILLPMLLGLALLFIGRGSMAMQRVEASHLKASLKKDGGGSS